MRISFNNRPVNHTRWKLIYLVCIFASLMFAPIGKANDTTKINRRPVVEYHNRLLENYIQYLEIRRFLYGSKRKTQKEKEPRYSDPIPDSEQTSPDPAKPQREQRRKQPLNAQSRAAFLLASVVPQEKRRRTNARRSHQATAAGASHQRQMHQAPDRILRLRGAEWS